MYCQDASRLISESLDNPIDQSRQQEFDAHLAECSACQDELACLQRLNAAYTQVKFAQPPPDFTNKVMQRIQQMKLRRSVLRGTITVLGVSVVGAVLFGVLLLFVSPLFQSLAQVPWVAVMVRALKNLASLGEVCEYALRLLFSTSSKTGFPFIVLGYLMLAVFLVIWWTRALLVPRNRVTAEGEHE
ncbi:MAG: anti-sigma factor family protein [Anaerolineae bacterium]